MYNLKTLQKQYMKQAGLGAGLFAFQTHIAWKVGLVKAGSWRVVCGSFKPHYACWVENRPSKSPCELARGSVRPV
ncbi:hypothetical protein M2105_005613 [Paenibacillus sp. PastF-1]|nr:hypothetical protein [Paenibacillus sp. PastF-2]MDF9850081.1 hypothetical protein [Paenibacillus sp. PastM-2]MDF9857715.1 hypothetical protein [Paenibacillus sp. PastF-1]MDH6482982.1 hypothetical protein [Paenibacillus sp. PastH-2]MDH6509215.1 hypothetical protein [Paenibacillus sp. PastM-3]